MRRLKKACAGIMAAVMVVTMIPAISIRASEVENTSTEEVSAVENSEGIDNVEEETPAGTDSAEEETPESTGSTGEEVPESTGGVEEETPEGTDSTGDEDQDQDEIAEDVGVETILCNLNLAQILCKVMNTTHTRYDVDCRYDFLNTL